MGESPHRTTVVHWDDRPAEGWVYIGRKGEGYFGNPYASGTREQNIARFKTYFERRLLSQSFRLAVYELHGKVLVCHCKPLACHGDVIAEYLNGL